MIKNSIIRKIRNTKWWQADGPVVFQLFQPPLIGTTKMAKYYPGLKFSMVIMLAKNDYGYQFMSEVESQNWIKFLIDKDKRNKKYIQNKIQKWRRFEKKVLLVIKEIERIDLSKIDNRKLWHLFNDFHKTLTDVWAILVLLDGNGIYFEKVLVPKMAKECNLTESEATDKLAILTMPEKASFIKKEQTSLLKIVLQFIKKRIPINISLTTLQDKYPAVYKMLADHQRKFFWIRNNYQNTQVISIKEFLKEIKTILKTKSKEKVKQEIDESENIKKIKESKKKIKKELGLSKQLARETDLFFLFGWWQDERKRICVTTSHYLSLLIKEISKRMDINCKNGYYLLNKEIEDFLLKYKRIDKNELKERKKLIVTFIYANETYDMITGREAKVYHNEIFRVMKSYFLEKGEKFKGHVACTDGKKKIKGKVSIVLNVKKDKFEKGNILVSSMTRPEFIPLIKRAKAIITNEGGITSHAAIVSRELNIPCIIGTKIATNMLKNGDYAELNLTNGFIKILKK